MFKLLLNLCVILVLSSLVESWEEDQNQRRAAAIRSNSIVKETKHSPAQNTQNPSNNSPQTGSLYNDVVDWSDSSSSESNSDSSEEWYLQPEPEKPPPPWTRFNRLQARNEKLGLFNRCIQKRGISSNTIVQRNIGNSTWYNKLDFRWSTRPMHVDPLAFYVPTTTSDVQIGVRCARELNISVVAKSGGHSQELFSSGDANTLVISFLSMNKIQIHSSSRTAKIEPGAVLGDVKKYLWKNGEFGASIGVCDVVGMGGIALGGGEGVVSPLYGYTSDNVLEMEMVDANGDLHIVNETSNEDLFWALRGSGSGFIGIVTSFKMKLFKASNLKLTVVKFEYGLEHTGPVFESYLKWMKFTIDKNLTVDSRLAMGSGLLGVAEMRVFLWITLTQDMIDQNYKERRKFFALVKRSFPTPENATFDFPDAMEYSGDITDEDTEVPFYVKMSNFFVKKVFNSSQLAEVVAAMKTAPLDCHVLCEGTGGSVSHQVPPNATAYVHRDDLTLLSIRINGLQIDRTERARALAWYNDIVPKFKFMDSGESYQNYVDLDLKDNYMKRYYGVNAQRLIEIKTKWDPQNYFKNPQSIPIAIPK